MADLTQIREAIAESLRSISDVQVSAYLLSNPTPPTLMVTPGEIDYHQALQDGMEMYTLRVQALVAHTGDIGPQQQLDGMLASTGNRSIKAAVELEPTLGGLVDDLVVLKTKGYHLVHVGQGATAQIYLGADLDVLVYTTGSAS